MGRKRKTAIADIPEVTWQRIEKVYLVGTGQMTARAAAQQLGVSPKTYYTWERRVLASSVQAVTQLPAGRPATVLDPEKEQLRTKLAAALQQVAELSAELKAQKLYTEYQQSQQEATGSAPLEEKKGR